MHSLTTRRPRTTPLALTLLLTVSLAGACSEDDPAETSSQPAATSAPTSSVETQTSEQAAATEAASQFLAALVAEDHDAAYGLLSPQAQAAASLEDFASARRDKNGSARSLALNYRLTGAAGDATQVTVTGEGRLADGTPADISLPLVATEQGWRVDAAPTAF